VVPLATDLAIRIIPDPKRARETPDLTFSNLTYMRRGQKRQAVIAVNRTVIQCAEEMVFFRDDYEWVQRFIAKNRLYRLESVNKKVRMRGVEVLLPMQRIRNHF
jgi:hypothetical protein